MSYMVGLCLILRALIAIRWRPGWGRTPRVFFMVDVRSPVEMAQGVLPNAESVPVHLVPVRMEEWRNPLKIVFY